MINSFSTNDGDKDKMPLRQGVNLGVPRTCVRVVVTPLGHQLHEGPLYTFTLLERTRKVALEKFQTTFNSPRKQHTWIIPERQRVFPKKSNL
jgi:hypothetical protein